MAQACETRGITEPAPMNSPSGRVVKNVLDNNGDLEIVQSKKTSSAGYWNYANNFTYNAAGAVTSMQLGNGHWESTAFNSRLQPTQIGLGITPGTTALLDLDYTYGTTANNGNVLTQTITVPRVEQAPFVFDQTYTYDELNRLKIAEEKTGSTTNWKQTFTIDRYGNRRFDQSNTSFPESFSNPNVSNPTFNAANNRFATGQTWAYDAAGNVVTDAESRTFIYDAENKQVEAKNSSNASLGTYFFDGDGKRVKKVVPTTGETTIFVYDAGAKLIAEYSTNVVPEQDAKVAYLTNDNLGTPRINTDRNGEVTSRSDYMPYGEEIIALGGRSGDEKYVTDGVGQGFTGYVNDGETGLDYAQARMYSKIQGRFISADEPFLDQTEHEPQTWNLYAYVRNNPLNLVDTTGQAADDAKACPEGKVCTYDPSTGKTTIEDDKEPIRIFETTTLTGRRPGRFFNQFQRFFGDVGRWFRDRFGPKGPPIRSTPAAPAQPNGGNQASQPNQVYGPPSPPNPRLNLPSASQRLDNLNGVARSQAEVWLRSDGFSLRSTSSGGYQRWVHPDGSAIHIRPNGEVLRIPTTSAAQQFGARGKRDGVRVDAGTGQIMRPGQHHNAGSPETIK